MSWLKFTIGVFLVGVATVTGTQNQLPDGVDSFRMIGAFPNVVAVYTSTNDSSFKCLSATRTNYDSEAKTASYVWPLRGHGGTERRNVTFIITPGEVRNQTKYFVDDDNSRVYTGYHHYTDYQNCMVMTIKYRDHDHCLLWVKRSVAHAVPQNCLDHYEAKCYVRVPTFDNDLCRDDE
nr:uncharacterized protein LOC119167651 [Rhipicephalus microplus]